MDNQQRQAAKMAEWERKDKLLADLEVKVSYLSDVTTCQQQLIVFREQEIKELRKDLDNQSRTTREGLQQLIGSVLLLGSEEKHQELESKIKGLENATQNTRDSLELVREKVIELVDRFSELEDPHHTCYPHI